MNLLPIDFATSTSLFPVTPTFLTVIPALTSTSLKVLDPIELTRTSPYPKPKSLIIPTITTTSLAIPPQN